MFHPFVPLRSSCLFRNPRLFFLPLDFFLQIEHANGLDQSLSIRRGTLKRTKIPMSYPESKGEYDMLARGIKPESKKEKI